MGFTTLEIRMFHNPREYEPLLPIKTSQDSVLGSQKSDLGAAFAPPCQNLAPL